MSLQRYLNREDLLQPNSPHYAQLYSNEDMGVLSPIVAIPNEPKLFGDVAKRSEIHVYTFYGDYLIGNHNNKLNVLDVSTNSLLIDVRGIFQQANISRGSYLIVYNLFSGIWGGFDNERVFVREISPDRTEIHLVVDSDYSGEIQQFQNLVGSMAVAGTLNNLAVNFGFNRIGRIVNIRFDGDSVFVKLYQPIDDDINIKDWAWFDLELLDPYVDGVILQNPISQGDVNYLGGPNFDIDVNSFTSNSTPFKSWDDILNGDLLTNQRIIDTTLSGSLTTKLNIDYTDFNNFVFYSSATERLKNLHYKVSKIEEYSSSIAILTESTASNSIFISRSIDLNQRRIDQITTTFTPFERWLYYSPTGSIFTHDISGSITPFPKKIFGGKFELYTVSSSIVSNWYNTLLTSASAYDERNVNRLYWSVPEHIIMDEGSSNFVQFVEMVGEHFDELYSFVRALPQIHSKEEHPERGVPADLLPHIAKSFGWELQNTRQLADLWTYKLGTNKYGIYSSTGSMFSLSSENQTHQIWRRIVNNLPFLLKTRGTGRALKALMNIYGIPQTLISIKEYGGPSPSTDRPTIIEDRFAYALHFTGSQYIQFPWSPTTGSWVGDKVPDTVEFRFRTNYSSSVSMSLWAMEVSGNRTLSNNLELVHYIANNPSTSSYLGSSAYGFLRYTGLYSGSTFISSSVTSSYLPLFDNDFWTVQLQKSPVSQSITIKVGRASDSLYGRISNYGKSSLLETSQYPVFWQNNAYITLGGTTGSNSNRFIGEMQGYKEWCEVISDDVYRQHILNPAQYSGNDATSSYKSLYRYYPLGLDQQRWDHSVYLNVSSSQPNRLYSYNTTASFFNFTGAESDQYRSVNETYYYTPPTLAGNTFRSEKIRLETSELFRNLTLTGNSELSAYDKSGYDTNRLAVVFAPNDHVNFDIFNQFGFSRLDNYIGDPDYEFLNEYSELRQFREEYLKKYQRRNDVNALIRILALYDYTFFEQVKQSVAGRADLITGVLLESDFLHRPKVVISKKPTIENPQWDADIPRIEPVAEAEVQQLEASASQIFRISTRYAYYTGSFNNVVFGTARYNYITGSFNQIISGSGRAVNYLSTGSRGTLGGEIDAIPTKYSGSNGETQSYWDQSRYNCCYSKVNYHYSASGIFANRYEKSWYTAVSMSYGMYYSRSLECAGYQNNECFVSNNHRFRGSKLSSANWNINSTETIDGGPVVTIWEANPNSLRVGDSPLGGKLIVS